MLFSTALHSMSSSQNKVMRNTKMAGKKMLSRGKTITKIRLRYDNDNRTIKQNLK